MSTSNRLPHWMKTVCVPYYGQISFHILANGGDGDGDGEDDDKGEDDE